MCWVMVTREKDKVWEDVVKVPGWIAETLMYTENAVRESALQEQWFVHL